MELMELQIFQHTEWLIAFILISLVGSFSRIGYNWKHTPKEMSLKNNMLIIFFGLVVCFFGEIALKTFEYQDFRVFLMFFSFLGEDVLEKVMGNKSELLDKIFNKSTNININKPNENEK